MAAEFDYWKWNLRVNVSILIAMLFLVLLVGGMKDTLEKKLKVEPQQVLKEVQDLKAEVKQSNDDDQAR